MQQQKAYTVERGGKVIGAIFPDRFSLRIVRVPFHDPDRDGAVNGYTHEVQLDFTGREIASIARSITGSFSGMQGSPAFLGAQLAGAVFAWNEAALLV